MKQEYVNPFIKASVEVLAQTTQLNFKTGAPSLRQSPFLSDEVLIMLGIVGSLKGEVILSMQRETSKSIASKMMMGMPVDELTEMAKSALCELGNMIMGNVATLLFNEGVQIDITPPTLLTGSNIEVSPTNMVTICIPIEAEGHRLILDVSIKEN